MDTDDGVVEAGDPLIQSLPPSFDDPHALLCFLDEDTGANDTSIDPPTRTPPPRAKTPNSVKSLASHNQLGQLRLSPDEDEELPLANDLRTQAALSPRQLASPSPINVDGSQPVERFDADQHPSYTRADSHTSRTVSRLTSSRNKSRVGVIPAPSPSAISRAIHRAAKIAKQRDRPEREKDVMESGLRSAVGESKRGFPPLPYANNYRRLGGGGGVWEQRDASGHLTASKALMAAVLSPRYTNRTLVQKLEDLKAPPTPKPPPNSVAETAWNLSPRFDSAKTRAATTSVVSTVRQPPRVSTAPSGATRRGRDVNAASLSRRGRYFRTNQKELSTNRPQTAPDAAGARGEEGSGVELSAPLNEDNGAPTGVTTSSTPSLPRLSADGECTGQSIAPDLYQGGSGMYLMSVDSEVTSEDVTRPTTAPSAALSEGPAAETFASPVPKSPITPRQSPRLVTPRALLAVKKAKQRGYLNSDERSLFWCTLDTQKSGWNPAHEKKGYEVTSPRALVDLQLSEEMPGYQRWKQLYKADCDNEENDENGGESASAAKEDEDEDGDEREQDERSGGCDNDIISKGADHTNNNSDNAEEEGTEAGNVDGAKSAVADHQPASANVVNSQHEAPSLDPPPEEAGPVLRPSSKSPNLQLSTVSLGPQGSDVAEYLMSNPMELNNGGDIDDAPNDPSSNQTAGVVQGDSDAEFGAESVLHPHGKPYLSVKLPQEVPPEELLDSGSETASVIERHEIHRSGSVDLKFAASDTIVHNRRKPRVGRGRGRGGRAPLVGVKSFPVWSSSQGQFKTPRNKKEASIPKLDLGSDSEIARRPSLHELLTRRSMVEELEAERDMWKEANERLRREQTGTANRIDLESDNESRISSRRETPFETDSAVGLLSAEDERGSTPPTLPLPSQRTQQRSVTVMDGPTEEWGDETGDRPSTVHDYQHDHYPPLHIVSGDDLLQQLSEVSQYADEIPTMAWPKSVRRRTPYSESARSASRLTHSHSSPSPTTSMGATIGSAGDQRPRSSRDVASRSSILSYESYEGAESWRPSANSGGNRCESSQSVYLRRYSRVDSRLSEGLEGQRFNRGSTESNMATG